MRNLIHKTDWSQTALGPVERWPRSLRLLVEVMLDHPMPMAVLWGPQLIQIYNDAHAAIINRKHPSALGKPVRECWPEVWGELEPVFQRVIASGQSLLVEDHLYRTNRTGVAEDAYFTVAYSPARDDEGKIGGLLATVIETTQRIRAQQQRLDVEKAVSEAAEADAFRVKLADAVRALSDPLDIQNTAARLLGEHLGANRVEYGDIIDESEAVIGGMYLNGIYPLPSPIPVAAFGEWILKAYRQNETVIINDVATDPRISEQERGSFKLMGVAAAISTSLIKNGRWVAAMGADSTTPRQWTPLEIALLKETASRTWAAVERARAEIALREMNERFRLAEAASNGYVYDYDLKTGKASRSEGFFRLTGYVENEVPLTFEAWLKMVHPEDWQQARSVLNKAIADGENAFTLEFRLRGRDGKWIHVLDRGIVIRDESGEPVRLVGSTVNVTERHRIAQEREELLKREIAARAEAEHAAKMKEEFLAVVSHELRTPLTAGLIWAKLLQSGELREDIKPGAIDKIVQSAEAQQRIIDDLLDVSRMISGKMRIKLRQAELVPILKEAIEAITPMARAKQIKVITRFEENRCRLRMDPDRIRQVMWNLLNNAVKFSDPGARVHVRMRCRNNSAEIRVRDTGIGITSEFLPYVFERFRQQDASPSRPFGGLGIGLAISKQLVELHGGTITAESDGAGKGAAFTITLPIARARRAGASSPRSGPGTARLSKRRKSARTT